MHDAVVVGSEGGRPLSVVLMEEGEEDWSNSLNAYALAEGIAVLEKWVKSSPNEVPEQVSSWQEFEDEARNSSSGLWRHGDAAGVLDDDEY